DLAGGALVDHLEALLDREQRLLRRVRHHRHDELVEDAQAALDEIQMAVVHRIEHPRIHRPLAHARPPSPRRAIRKSGKCPKTLLSLRAGERKSRWSPR